MNEVPRSGRQFQITDGPYSAVIASVGATLRSLDYRDPADGRTRALTATFPAEQVRPASLGAPLLPWPNRIAGGHYDFAGQTHQLAITEPERGNAIHGLAAWLDWQPTEVRENSLTLRTLIAAQPGFGSPLAATSHFMIDTAGLHWSITVENIGPAATPYGVATHPYLVAPAGRTDDWSLHVPARSVLDVTADTKLPRDLHPVDALAGGALDFTVPRTIGPVHMDHALTGIDSGADGMARVELRRAAAADDTGSASGVALSWDAHVLPWVQVFTADLPDHPDLNRRAVAVEAMSCPPDAFNSGTDLMVLEPGQGHTADWQLSAIGGMV